jgi:HKD family nuclease
MKITFLTEDTASREIVRLIEWSDYIDVAVAWAGQGEIINLLSKQSLKLRHLVVGTHLYQTHPEALRMLMACPTAKCFPPNGKRLFHPKVYLFEREGVTAAVVGSHNLTSAAFKARNVEASLLMRAPANIGVVQELAGFIRESWDAAHIISKGFLARYKAQYKANRDKRAALEKFDPPKNATRNSDRCPVPQELLWKDFVERISSSEYNDLKLRLQVLERAGVLFAKRPHFGQLASSDQRGIAGTREGGQYPGDPPWGWFGRMSGHGDFTNLVATAPQRLSRALDCIPRRGIVTERAYRNFVKAFGAAFTGKIHKGSCATASRLLAMKRPDVFICVNNANKRELCSDLNVAPSTLNLDNYWDRIVLRIQASPWWRQPSPKENLERRIWDSRAALLDCLYYIP